jgi:hypothetical protein
LFVTLLSLALLVPPAPPVEVPLVDPTPAELDELAECMAIFRHSADLARERGEDAALPRSGYVLAHTTAVGLAMARWGEDAAAATRRVRALVRDREEGAPRVMIVDEEEVRREPCLARLLAERAALYRDYAEGEVSPR